MKKRTTNWAITLTLVCANLVLWAMPCDLAYNVAQHREILMGRYTVDRLTTLFIFTPVSLLVIASVWLNKKGEKNKAQRIQDLFKATAITVSIIVSISAVDIFLRLSQRRQYVGDRTFYHRVPDRTQQGVFKDVPETAFSYIVTPPGYPDIDYTFTTDKRGFRNKSDLEKYDVVVLGDSFTEGSGVSDEHAWPVLFSQKSGLTVYNLGMSGGSPATYLETLKKFGLALSPKLVVCVLYEGNDFRASNFSKPEKKRSTSFRDLFRSSPLRTIAKRAMIRCFGPVSRTRFSNTVRIEDCKVIDCPTSHPLYAVSWLPVRMPDEPNGKYYAFKVKRLLSHLVSTDELLDSTGCQATFKFLREIKKICLENNIRFIVMYVPDKPHVLLPLARDSVSDEMLHAFMALKEKNLPDAEGLFYTILPNLNVHEAAMQNFCQQESIPFIGLTEPLRRQIAAGSQLYFTYDQHWTPLGHEIAAEILAGRINVDAK